MYSAAAAEMAKELATNFTQTGMKTLATLTFAAAVAATFAVYESIGVLSTPPAAFLALALGAPGLAAGPLAVATMWASLDAADLYEAWSSLWNDGKDQQHSSPRGEQVMEWLEAVDRALERWFSERDRPQPSPAQGAAQLVAQMSQSGQAPVSQTSLVGSSSTSPMSALHRLGKPGSSSLCVIS
jgi:hypothetical protein